MWYTRVPQHVRPRSVSSDSAGVNRKDIMATKPSKVNPGRVPAPATTTVGKHGGSTPDRGRKISDGRNTTRPGAPAFPGTFGAIGAPNGSSVAGHSSVKAPTKVEHGKHSPSKPDQGRQKNAMPAQGWQGTGAPTAGRKTFAKPPGQRVNPIGQHSPNYSPI